MGPPAVRRLAPAVATALLAAVTAASAAPSPSPSSAGWRGCCGLTPWAEAGPISRPGGESSGLLFGGYASLVAGSSVRHHVGVSGRIPAPYTHLRNPLAATPQNAQRGASIYEAQCASCHGAAGAGDGPGAKKLTPPPAQLGWLAKVPASRRGAFIYWSVAEGGQPFGTGMPAFKDKLDQEQIWSVVGYLEARLPPTATPPR